MATGRHVADAALALALVGVSVAYGLIARSEVGAGKARDIVGQAGYPQALAVLAATGSLYVAARSLWRWRKTRHASPGQAMADEEPREEWVAVALWVVMAAYALSLTVVGFWMATILAVGGALWLLGYRRPLLLPVVAVGTALVLYGIFDMFLNVRLPSSSLWGL